MSTKDRFIERIEPFVVATALSGQLEASDGIDCYFLNTKVGSEQASWIVYFFKGGSIGTRVTVGSSTYIRGDTCSVEDAVDRIISEITEYLNR